MTLSEQVAEEIRVLMARRRLRQSQLARLVGENDQWMSVRLRGVQPIDLNDLQRIAEALSVDPISLLPTAAGGPTRGSGSANRRRDRRDTHASSVLAVTIPAGHVRPQASRPPNYPRAARRPIVSSGFAA